MLGIIGQRTLSYHVETISLRKVRHSVMSYVPDSDLGCLASMTLTLVEYKLKNRSALLHKKASLFEEKNPEFP